LSVLVSAADASDTLRTPEKAENFGAQGPSLSAGAFWPLCREDLATI
jgi:hypothetical protein